MSRKEGRPPSSMHVTSSDPPPDSFLARAPLTVGRSLEPVASEDVVMDLLVDKLMLLNYERDFCRRKKPHRKTMSRTFFAIPAAGNKQSDQFYYFTSMVSWLLQLCGLELPPMKEFDDPNSSCTTIVAGVRQLGFAPPTYPLVKLTAGYGREVCGFLDAVVDYVLEKKRFKFRTPVHPPDDVREDDLTAEGEDEGTDIADEGVNEGLVPDDSEDDQAFLPGAGGGEGTSRRVEDGDRQILESKADPVQWQMEVERVAPRLHIPLPPDSQDWQSHLDQCHQQYSQVQGAWPQCQGLLTRILGDLSNHLDKLTTREKFLNEQFTIVLQQYKMLRDQLLDSQSQHNGRSEVLAQKNDDLQQLVDQLEEVKRTIEERSGNISDTSPVVQVKAAIKALSKELKEMDVRIGVLSHTLLQLAVKDPHYLQDVMARDVSL